MLVARTSARLYRNRKLSGSVFTAIAELDSERDLTPIRALPDVRVDVFTLGLEALFVELAGPARQEHDRSVAERGVTT